MNKLRGVNAVGQPDSRRLHQHFSVYFHSFTNTAFIAYLLRTRVYARIVSCCAFIGDMKSVAN